jgi:hypothetical protein
MARLIRRFCFDAMPAGGNLSQNDWILILLLAILLVVLL